MFSLILLQTIEFYKNLLKKPVKLGYARVL